jgi:shikimate dehydrogenase (EC 1.1.1.25)
VGYNTDAHAVYRLAGPYMKGAEVLILGAGGAARAAAFAAVKAEAKAVYIYNRTRERAEALAGEFAEKFGRRVEAVGAPVRADVVINATPVHDGTELEFVIMVIAVSCVKLLSAHNSTQHTSRKHKV